MQTSTREFVFSLLATVGLCLNRHRRADMKAEAMVAEGTSVPKIIHQTYKNRVFPPEVRHNIEKIKELNPNWEYRFYDDDNIKNYLSKHFPEALQHYDRINPIYGAARADLFRYLLLYREGGVYLDIKSALTKPLDQVIEAEDQYLLSHWPSGEGEKFKGWGSHWELETTGGEFQQWFIVAAPGHPFLKAVIGNVLKNIDIYNPGLHGVGRNAVLRLTGPIAYTLAIAPLLRLYKHRLVQSDKDLGFKYTNFAYKKLYNTNDTHYAELSEPVLTVGPIKYLFAAAVNSLK